MNLQSQWQRAGLLCLVLCSVLVGAYFPTWREMFALWTNTETYTHGPLVPLISAWLVWRIRKSVGAIAPQFSVWGVVLMLGAATVWALADIVQVSAARHFAVLTLLVGVVIAVLGTHVARAVMFPLAFLYFAVPFGDFLTEPMMEQTADFTVAALQWTGIPVYREARHIQVPSGSWAVVEACSGTRYLIASVMLGALFSYLFYRSTKRRILFMLAAIVIPIVGNWVRAYLIVMVGHITNNKYGLGADHVLFGWVFFGVLIYGMFAIGARWREDDDDGVAAEKSTPAPAMMAGHTPSALGGFAPALTPALAAAFAAVIPWLTSHATTDSATVTPPAAITPAGWVSREASATSWKPQLSGGRGVAHAELIAHEGNGGVTLYRARYAGQRGDARMVRFGNEFRDTRMIESAAVKTRTHTIAASALESTPRVSIEYEGRERDLVRVTRGTFVIAGATYADPYRAKLALAVSQLTGRGDASTAVVWSALARDGAAARATLDAFERAAGAALTQQ